MSSDLIINVVEYIYIVRVKKNNHTSNIDITTWRPFIRVVDGTAFQNHTKYKILIVSY